MSWPSTSSSTGRSSRARAGSSTTRWRSGQNTRRVVGGALGKADLTAADLAAVGITNQRETTVVWDRRTGKPIHNAIVWQDTRTQAICDELARDGGIERFRTSPACRSRRTSPAPRSRWILDHVEGARERAEAGELLFGTIDSWLLWNLTGGAATAASTSPTSRTPRARC